MSVAKDVKTLIASINTNTYTNDMPDAPDNCVCIYNTGGYETEYVMNNDIDYERPTIQIRVRNTSYETADAQLVAIKQILDKQSETTINSTKYMTFYCISDILRIGRNDRERTVLAVNYEINLKR